MQCPQTGRWAPLDRRALARLDEEPEALLAPATPAELERIRAARRSEAQRAARAAPSLLVQLRDGAAWPFGALTERSKELSGPSLELLLQRAGRELCARVLVDPSGAGVAGWSAEERLKKQAAADERAAEARAARAAKLRAELRAEAQAAT